MTSGKLILDQLASQFYPSAIVGGEVYKIGELAEEFDVSLRTLRFYEDFGLISPERTGNKRLYSSEDKLRLKLILFVKNIGFSLQDIKEILTFYDSCNNSIIDFIIEKMKLQQAIIVKQKSDLDHTMDTISSALQFLSITED